MQHSPQRRCSACSTSQLPKPLVRTVVALAVLTSGKPALAEWLDLKEFDEPALQVALSDPAYVQVQLPAAVLHGRWVRVTARVQGPPGEVRATVVAQATGQRVSQSAPTTCDAGTVDRTCEALAWIPSEADQVKVTVWSASTPANLSSLRIQYGEGQRVDPAAVARLDSLVGTIAELYYRSEEVNWPKLRQWIAPALNVPADIDPVPGAIRSLITVLPGGRHNALVRTTAFDLSSRKKSESLGGALPTCRAIANGVHLLWLPGTTHLDEELDETYVQAAQKCLLSQPKQTRWIIDLRECSGGSSDLALSALSPLLDQGELFQWQNGHGRRIQVAITNEGVSTGGSIGRPSKLPVGKRRSAPAIAWIGRTTASACEVAAAALSRRSNTRLLGEPSAGLTTGNEVVEVPPHHLLYLTAGRLLIDSRHLDEDRLTPDRNEPNLTDAEVAERLRDH